MQIVGYKNRSQRLKELTAEVPTRTGSVGRGVIREGLGTPA